MITDWQLQRRDDSLILGLALECAVLDIVSNDHLLTECIALLQAPPGGLLWTRMGRFGEFDITLNRHHDGRISIFVDGPDFEPGRVQSAAIWVEREQLQSILSEVVPVA